MIKKSWNWLYIKKLSKRKSNPKKNDSSKETNYFSGETERRRTQEALLLDFLSYFLNLFKKKFQFITFIIFFQKPGFNNQKIQTQLFSFFHILEQNYWKRLEFLNFFVIPYLRERKVTFLQFISIYCKSN